MDVQFVYIPSSGTNVQALLGGSIDVMIAGSSGIVSAAARGAPLVAIASQMNRPPVTLYVQPHITKPDQLRNQVLGITRYGSSTHALSRLVLQKFGLEKNVTLRPLGETPRGTSGVRAEDDRRHAYYRKTANNRSALS